MMIKVKTYCLFLLTEDRHGYRGHQEQALGLSVKQLWYTFIKINEITLVRHTKLNDGY